MLSSNWETLRHTLTNGLMWGFQEYFIDLGFKKGRLQKTIPQWTPSKALHF